MTHLLREGHTPEYRQGAQQRTALSACGRLELETRLSTTPQGVDCPLCRHLIVIKAAKYPANHQELLAGYVKKALGVISEFGSVREEAPPLRDWAAEYARLHNLAVSEIDWDIYIFDWEE